ncbi:hypothetical protein NE848_09870 [Gramella jeungdoensis]|uniref:Uncharacterized protein n=1 Tax=Gramella jeungdoensis TaxID=708091 RepID=A0ABT0Z1U6_9FLAO|nr:hypothetical protein [Gramella jeungdoensis]MCM8569687.1 hypothetical protein [Gramella jeungdoensis]
MKSSEKHPFAFFDKYLEEDIYKDWRKFKKGLIDEQDIYKIDEENHIICTKDYDGINKYSFETEIKPKLIYQRRKTQQFIELNSQKLEERYNSDFYLRKIEQLEAQRAYKEFNFLEPIFSKIKETIKFFGKEENFEAKQESCFSFQVTGSTEEEKLNKLDKLYEMLVQDPPFIATSKDNFRKAFNSQNVDEGIKWLVKAKNKHTNKQSLFYLLESLISEGHIKDISSTHFNRSIYHVFRTTNGNRLKNIKQSKSNKTSVPERSTDIDIIISRL